jgi:flagellar hook-length control protein FliK
MNMMNLIANNIAAAPQISGKTGAAGTVKSGDGSTAPVSFLEMLHSKSASAASVKENPPLSVWGELQSGDDPGTEEVSIFKLLEMIGVPQDIAQEMHDYFTFDVNNALSGYASGTNLNYAEGSEFIAELAQDLRIPEGVREMLADFSQRVNLAISAVSTSMTAARFDANFPGYAEFTQISGIDVYSMLRDALVDFAAGKTGQPNQAMKDRAELMTKAIERLDGTGKPETVTVQAGKSSGSAPVKITQTIQQVTITETTVTVSASPVSPVLSVQDMLNMMKMGKMPSELLDAANAQEASGSVGDPAGGAKTVGAAPDANILQLASDTQNAQANGTADMTEELTLSEAKSVKGRQAGITGKSDAGETQAKDTKISGDLSRTQERAQTAAQAASNQANQAGANQPSVPETEISQSAKEISRIVAENMNARSSSNVSKGEFEISMKLSPKDLGELLIKVSYNSSTGSVVLDIIAANEAAQAGVLSRIAELRESLAMRGVNLENVEVNSGNPEHNGQQSGNAQRDAYNSNNNGRGNNNGGSSFRNSLGLGSDPSEIIVDQEAARREMIMNHMRNRRLLHRTI